MQYDAIAADDYIEIYLLWWLKNTLLNLHYFRLTEFCSLHLRHTSRSERPKLFQEIFSMCIFSQYVFPQCMSKYQKTGKQHESVDPNNLCSGNVYQWFEGVPVDGDGGKNCSGSTFSPLAAIFLKSKFSHIPSSYISSTRTFLQK